MATPVKLRFGSLILLLSSGEKKDRKTYLFSPLAELGLKLDGNKIKISGIRAAGKDNHLQEINWAYYVTRSMRTVTKFVQVHVE